MYSIDRVVVLDMLWSSFTTYCGVLSRIDIGFVVVNMPRRGSQARFSKSTGWRCFLNCLLVPSLPQYAAKKESTLPNPGWPEKLQY